ncbi:hypothetical protein [Fructobacillus parabroussonetiae]|uniref:Uncharacterized protein n=1 Tax=Fructobacillus parabroussonetiae TaxID=2713174 RepID=A0ABS5QXL5_9LACO|nr:hypothetical protein [Fructobacillus parabroussonetiae]MBS9337340.1 hypothetical protein [Fructobacillus parabroussonetiae]
MNQKVELFQANSKAFYEIVSRYFELNPEFDKKDKAQIISSNIYMQLSILDIVNLYQKYTSEKFSTSDFYKLVVKVHTLYETFIAVAKKLKVIKSIKEQSDTDGTWEITNRFLAFRSLTIAHPIGTDKHKKYGLDGTVWLEEIVDLKEPNNSHLIRTNYEKTDFLLKYIKLEGDELTIKSFNNLPVNLDSEIFEVARIVDDKMKMVNDGLLEKIRNKEQEYINREIKLSTELNEKDFEILKDETIKRYPEILSSYSWSLKDVYEIIKYAKEQNKVEIVEYLKNAVWLYKKQLQEMDFSRPISLNDENDSIERINRVLKPSLKTLASRIGRSLFYEQEKLNLYLRPEVIEDLSNLPDEGQRHGDASNALWAMKLLKGLNNDEPELDISFFDGKGEMKSLRNLYHQYVVSVFYYNKKYKKTDFSSLPTPEINSDDITIIMDDF